MINQYTVLRFATLENFIDYLKAQNIHRYGLITYAKNERGVLADDSKKPMGVQWVTVAWRLTAKDPVNHEILVIDLTFYRDIYVTAEHTRQQCEKPMKEMLGSIDKFLKEHVKEYKLDRIDAEFQVEE